MPYKIISEEEQTTCLECGREVYGRSDKKFCSESCRNSFHNRETNRRKHMENSTFKVLRNNYDILERFLKMGTTSVPLEILDNTGYKKEVVTGHRKTETGHDEYVCFDIRYCQTGRKIFRLERLSSTVPQAPAAAARGRK